MPILAFSFGSFGDIATILQLAFQLRAALNDASGASAEVRALVADFDQFTLVVQQAKAVIERPQSGLQPDVRTAITAALARCQDVLLQVQRKIRTFEQRMTACVGRAAWRGYWAAAAWEILGGKKEVDALRARLAGQVMLLQTYLSVSSCRDQESILASAHQQHCLLKDMRATLETIQRHFGPEMPSFMFEDPETGELYQPFMRITFEYRRLDTVSAAFADIPGRDWMKQESAPPFRSHIHVQDAFSADSYVETAFFKNRFGGIDVLLGLSPTWGKNNIHSTHRVVERNLCEHNGFPEFIGHNLGQIHPEFLKTIHYVSCTYSTFIDVIRKANGNTLDTRRLGRLLLSTLPDPLCLEDYITIMKPRHDPHPGRPALSPFGMKKFAVALRGAATCMSVLQIDAETLRSHIRLSETCGYPEIIVSPWISMMDAQASFMDMAPPQGWMNKAWSESCTYRLYKEHSMNMDRLRRFLWTQ